MDGGQVEGLGGRTGSCGACPYLVPPSSWLPGVVFPDASECHWGSFVTQVPDAEVDQNLPVEDMTHELLALLSGTFKGSQMRWATIDKEGFAIVSPFRLLEHFLWNGVHIFTDHRNLAYIFDPERA